MKINDCKDRTWIELNKEQLIHNYLYLKNILNDNCKIAAVVKANAYGHGLIAVSKILEDIGVDFFCVTTIEEGIKLRRKHVKKDILVLGKTGASNISKIKKYNLIQVISDFEYADMIAKMNKKIRVHIEIDSGLHRTGFELENIEKLKLLLTFKGIKVEGFFTHFNNKHIENIEKDGQFQAGIKYFYNVLYSANIDVSMYTIHFLSSALFLSNPMVYGNYVRLGAAIYGLSDYIVDDSTGNLSPIISLKSKVIEIKKIKKGDKIGYDNNLTATNDMKIAILPIGYADGFPVSMGSRNWKVICKGEVLDVLYVFMDLSIVDITGKEFVKTGDEVIILDRKKEDFEEFAEKSHKALNEVVTSFSTRVPRLIV